MNMNKKAFAPVVLACLLMFSPASCDRKAEEKVYRKSTVLMDTVVAISVASESDEKAEEAIDAAFLKLVHLQKLLSFWDKRSEISRINEYAGISPVKVSRDTFDIIEKAVYISESTGGAFDATIGPVIRLWDFKKGVRPDAEKIKEALGGVDYRKMVLDRGNSTAFLSKRAMSFDTGGIAKGYGADAAVRVLKERGIGAGLVAIAGDIKAFGLKPDGKPWKIGIRSPRPEGNEEEIMAEIELKDEAISTSGDYERFFIENGVRYHHLIDPKNGMPARGVLSASVVSKDSVLSDGFSTGVFVLGPEKGIEALNACGLEGIIVDENGKIHMTGGLKERLRITGGNFKAN